METEIAKDTVRACRHCFMCRYTCPLFMSTKWESMSPRGYAILLSEIRQGCRVWTKEIAEKFYQCTLCGLGRQDCEFHWPEDEMVRQAREQMVEENCQPPNIEQFARTLFQPDLVDLADRASSLLLPEQGVGSDVQLLYYPGDGLGDSGFREIGNAVARLLDWTGEHWGNVPKGLSCGTVLFELGYSKEAAEIAWLFATVVNATHAKILLVSSPHSYRTIRELFPSWGIELRSGLEVLHVSQFFARLIAEGVIRPASRIPVNKVGYHDPCQLGRKMGEYEAPRSIIAAVQGREALELFHCREKAECCGAGATTYLTYPHAATRIAEIRLRSALEEGVDLLVTACPNCKSVFIETCHQLSLNLRIMDIAEVLFHSLKRGEGTESVRKNAR